MIRTAKCRRAIGVLATGVLLAFVAATSAQSTGGGPDDPYSTVCGCTAGGAMCLFGSNGGCMVVGCRTVCKCISGGCWWGFPIPAICTCSGS